MKPRDVFTPKGATVNDDMYIRRASHENALERAIEKSKHIIIHGESGTGKTWLYKKILKDRKINYEVLNAATINTSGSLSEAIEGLLARLKPVVKTAYEEKKAAELNVGLAKGNLEHTGKYDYRTTDPFLSLVSEISQKARNQESFLVIENLEHIVRDTNLIKELTSIILYLDDELYAQHNVRLMLVGTPNNIREYFSNASDDQTIINRTLEIPEVATLNESQTSTLVKKGFFEFLKYKLQGDEGFDEDVLNFSIQWFSLNIPQYIHEIGLDIALLGKANNGVITHHIVNSGITNWVADSMVAEHARIEKHTNSIETKHGRRNQVLYAMAQFKGNEFSVSEIEGEVREYFPKSTSGKTLNISGILGELSKNDSPIIRKSMHGNRYRFVDPKIKIMCRWVLQLSNETIAVRRFDESIRI